MAFSIQPIGGGNHHHISFKNTALDPHSQEEQSGLTSQNPHYNKMAQHTEISAPNGSEPYRPNIQITPDKLGKAFDMTDLNAQEKEVYRQQSSQEIIANIDLTNTNPSDFNMAILTLSHRGEIPPNQAGVMAGTVSMDENLKGVDSFNAIEYFKGVSIGGYDKTGYTGQGVKTLQALQAAHDENLSLINVDMEA